MLAPTLWRLEGFFKSLHGITGLSWYLATEPKVDLDGIEEISRLGCSLCRIKWWKFLLQWVGIPVLYLRKQKRVIFSRALTVGEAERRSWSNIGWRDLCIQPFPPKQDQYRNRAYNSRDFSGTVAVLAWFFYDHAPMLFLMQKALKRYTGLVGLYMLHHGSLQTAADDLQITPSFLRWKNLVNAWEQSHSSYALPLSSWGRGWFLNKVPLPGPVKQIVAWWSLRSVFFACTSVLIILNCSN